MDDSPTSTKRGARAKASVSAKHTDLCNIVCVSDLHAGCRLALCPPSKIRLDDGGTYEPSGLQKKLWAMWREFWDEFVPEATRREPYGVVINGDCVDGVHHRSTTQISHNLTDQNRIAYDLLSPVVDKAHGRVWLVRGTEAHVGSSASEEESLGERLGVIPSPEGQFARWELWKKLGNKKLLHFLHHVGSTGSQAYESTAVHKELVESFVEAARWRREPPDLICRSHRHRCIETMIPTGDDSGGTSKAIAVVTPCWQGKTPFVWKIPGGRLSTPQFGGIVIRYAKGELFVRTKVWTVGRSEVE